MFLSELELSVDAVPCGQAEPVDHARLRVEPLYDDVLKQIPYKLMIYKLTEDIVKLPVKIPQFAQY